MIELCSLTASILAVVFAPYEVFARNDDNIYNVCPLEKLNSHNYNLFHLLDLRVANNHKK